METEERHSPAILVVDDEETVRNLLERMLRRNGYECELAADARQARHVLESRHFDLMLCDLKMPGESGLDLARYVSEAFPDTAIVMVTVIEDRQTAKAALDMGVYGYVIKPFDENQIIIAVANALRRRELEITWRSHKAKLEEAVAKRTADLVKANEQLKKRERELHARTEELVELNSALRVLLKKREEDRSEMEEKILLNVKHLVSPYLERLKQSRLSSVQRSWLGMVESNLRDLIAPMARKLSAQHVGLTPTELQIADLIKRGKTSKEIAATLHLSHNTIISHRYRIRTKLGLRNRDVNLQSYLQTLDD
ncbi:MAG: DNA-binding response regulator [Deltaproteobacteria bacterium]|nr:DNA-binding response regulator [Deltaproteobacteria bacterium]